MGAPHPHRRCQLLKVAARSYMGRCARAAVLFLKVPRCTGLWMSPPDLGQSSHAWSSSSHGVLVGSCLLHDLPPGQLLALPLLLVDVVLQKQLSRKVLFFFHLELLGYLLVLLELELLLRQLSCLLLLLRLAHSDPVQPVAQRLRWLLNRLLAGV